MKGDKAKESALEKFEKELAEKKKILLQPVVRSSSTSQQGMLPDQSDSYHQYSMDNHGHYMGQPDSGHFLPQPFPVHQQNIQPQPFPMPSQLMGDQQVPPGYTVDPNTGIMQPVTGPPFYPDQMPLPGPAPGMHFQGPQGMFPMGPGHPAVDPSFLPMGHNLPGIPEGPLPPPHIGPEGMYLDPQGHDFAPNYGAGDSYRDFGREGRKQGRRRQSGQFYEPQVEDFTKNEANPRTSIDSIHEVEMTILPETRPDDKLRDEDSTGKTEELEPKTETDSTKLDRASGGARVKKGFSRWGPVIVQETEEVARGLSEAELEIKAELEAVEESRLRVKREDPQDSGASMTPQSQSEDVSDSDGGVGKPIKVKSRWRRASEAEAPPTPPPPSKDKPNDGKKEKKDEEEEKIPINFDLITENVYLTERLVVVYIYQYSPKSFIVTRY